MLSTAPTVDELRQVKFFASLSDDALQEFRRQVSVRAFGPRELILMEGDECDGFYFMRNGKARIFRTSPDGREQSFRLIGPGETFGEVPVFDGQSNPATVEALEHSEVLVFPSSAVHEVVRQNPDVALALLTHFSRRLRMFTEIVEHISLQTVPARIARYLYQLAREEGQTSPEGIVVPRSITHRDLASLVGTVREVVSRSLKTMEEDGIIIVRRHEIVIRDLGALRHLA